MKKLNIIWILAEAIGSYGGDSKRSKYKLMEEVGNDGVEFNNMIVSAPSTVMAITSMMTSYPAVYISRTYADFNYDTKRFISLVKILKNNGYNTYTTIHYTEGRKLLKDVVYPLGDNELPKGVSNEADWSAEDCKKVFLEILRKGLKEPYFLLINFTDFHDKKKGDIDEIIHKLKKEGLYENTLFILCSDHGWPDEKLNRPKVRHDLGIRDDNLFIPFTIKYPDCPKIKINKLVSSLDITPTILDLLKIPFNMYNFKGESLLPLIEGKNKYNETKFRSDVRYHLQSGRVTSLRSENFKYIHYSNLPEKEQEEFFDVKNDPLEKNNIINSKEEEHIEKVKEFRDEFWKRENEAIQFHYDYLLQKFNKHASGLFKPPTKEVPKILLFGSCHKIFLKILVKAIDNFFKNYQLCLYTKKGAGIDKESNVDRNKISTFYGDLSYKDFKENFSHLAKSEYDLAIVPLSNPYGVGYMDIIRILRKIKPKNTTYIDYNMDLKEKPKNWFLSGLRLVKSKLSFYKTHPHFLVSETIRYLKDIKQKRTENI